MKTKTTIFGLAAVLILAIAAITFAHGGYGSHMGSYGGGHMMGPGYGGHMMGWDSDDGSYCRGYGARGNLSDADAAKLDKSREKFYTDTRDLRKQIDQKQMALSREMDKVNPDQGKIFELQKEISSLRSDFDQKAIAHQMEMRRLLPDNYRGSGYGRGYCW